MPSRDESGHTGPVQDRGSERHLFVLSSLVQLEQRARQAGTEAELGFVMVNETLRLAAYRQALFFAATGPGLRLRAASGVDAVDPQAPYVTFLTHLLKRLSILKGEPVPRSVSTDQLTPEERDRCRQHGIGTLLWCPLNDPGRSSLGGLLFVRADGWTDGEIEVLARLADAYGHAWWALGRGGSLKRRLARWRWPKAVTGAMMIALIGAIALLPVRLSVLAPVEIVPKDPVVVSPPRDGVIRRFAVQPNEMVKQGALLFSLEDTPLRNAHAVAQKALAVVQADLLRVSQKAFGDADSRSKMALLEAQIEQKRAEIRYLAEMLTQSRIKADRKGLAVFDDVNDWLGRPVQVGEKILTLANPDRVEADIRLAVEDAINLNPGAEVRVFLNIHPDRPLTAALRSAGFEARPTTDGILAFRLRADLDQTAPLPRIGLRGTAKIYGETVTLGYYVLRRPLAACRRWLGV
ncbi:MAG: HlyD family efflux transporter periplasmic adaptor subunit [Desulfatibacillum sp.]|nr:HlyD family efflux transporter periplasmic adaptor subunit [Desulfatibacillum sp.]